MGSETQEGIPSEENCHAQISQGQQVVPATMSSTPEGVVEQNIDNQPAPSSSSSSSSISSSVPPERKVSTEDSTAIIESLRARLLSERNSSKAAKQHAQELTKKVKELEQSLEAEIQHRKRCEEVIQELLLKLDEAGVKLAPEENSNSTSEDPQLDDDEEQKTVSSSSKKSKPNWISFSKRHYSDMEGDTIEQSSPSESPVSDSSLVPRRVGRSCRTVRRKEAWELGVDERVKSWWSKVGADVVELAKIREVVGSESGWLSHALDLFESSGEQLEIEKGDQQQREISTASLECSTGSSSSSSSSSSVGMESSVKNSEISGENFNTPHDHDPSDGLQSNNARSSGEIIQTSPAVHEEQARTGGGEEVEEAAISNSQQVPPVSTEETFVVSASLESGAGLPVRSQDNEARNLQAGNPSEQSSTSSNGFGAPRDNGSNSSVEDILRALRIAKHQVLAGKHGSFVQGGGGGGTEFPRSFASDVGWQPRYESASHGFVVTRPLAQFVHAAAPQLYHQHR